MNKIFQIEQHSAYIRNFIYNEIWLKTDNEIWKSGNLMNRIDLWNSVRAPFEVVTKKFT